LGKKSSKVGKETSPKNKKVKGKTANWGGMSAIALTSGVATKMKKN